MHRLRFGTQLKTPPIDHVTERLLWCKSNLAEIKRNLDEIDCNVDNLLDQFAGNRAPESHNIFVPGNVATSNGSRPSFTLTPHRLPPDFTAPSRIQNQGGPLDLEEFNPLGGYPHLVKRGLG